MYGWFYKILAAKRFRSQARLSFGLSRAFKELTFDRIEEVIVTTQANHIRMADNFNKYKVLQNDLQECYYTKDEFDYITRYNDPIITPSQESRYRFLRSMLWLSIGVFLIIETILFFMISENITGGIVYRIETMGTEYAKYASAFLFVASAMFALVSALMLDAGLRQVFHFFKAKKHYANKFVDIATYRSASVKFFIGLTLLAGTVMVLVLLNWARANAIDGTSSNNPVLAYALVALSVFAGIAFGIVKKELAENSELISLANKWRKVREEMASAHKVMAELSIRIQNQFSLVINKAHCLGVDLQELMEREYDERDQELAAQFRDEVRSGKYYAAHADGHTIFKISPADANYYQNLITNEVFLHRNYFTTHERLAAIMQDMTKMMSAVNSLEDERLTRLSKPFNKSDDGKMSYPVNNGSQARVEELASAQTNSSAEIINGSTLSNNHSQNGKHLTTH